MIGLLMLVAAVSVTNAEIRHHAHECGVPRHKIRISRDTNGARIVWLHPDDESFSFDALHCFSHWAEGVGVVAALDFIPEEMTPPPPPQAYGVDAGHPH